MIDHRANPNSSVVISKMVRLSKTRSNPTGRVGSLETSGKSLTAFSHLKPNYIVNQMLSQYD